MLQTSGGLGSGGSVVRHSLPAQDTWKTQAPVPGLEGPGRRGNGSPSARGLGAGARSMKVKEILQLSAEET